MKIIFTVLLAMLCCVPPLAPPCYSATNLAKGKQYTVSPVHNYSLSAPSSDTSALTDGVYTSGYFWTQKTTIGWQKARTVEILFDLEQESDIEGIAFNTARRKDAGVFFPAHIAVFVGVDKEHLLYVGDLADNPENQPGAYQVRKFTLNGLGVRGRYVLLEAIPKGVFLFCDEVEVWEGNSAQRKTGDLSVGKAREFAESIILRDRDKYLFNRMADNLAAFVSDRTDAARLQEIRRLIRTPQTSGNSEAIESELLALRRQVLSRAFPGEGLHVQNVNPWAQLDPFSPVSDNAGNSLSLVLPKGGYDSGAMLVTNLSTRPLGVTCALEKTPGGFDLFLYQVPFVKTAAMEQVADPLVPVRGEFKLRPGESRVVFLTVHGKQPGFWVRNLHIDSGDKVTSFPVTIRVVNLELPGKLSLNAVNWGYLDFRLVKDRQKAAVEDLLGHHTNVVVVPPGYLPEADPVNTPDFSRLETYLELHRGFGKVLLFMNLRPDYRLKLGGGYPFLGEHWKAAVKRWYEGARQTAVRAGYPPEHVYWYPYDEMEGKEIDQFILLANWAKSEIPGVKLYATLGRKDSEKVLPFLDVSQILNDERTLGRFSAKNGEKWLYAAEGPAKSLSPYAYYRLMAWKAFLNGYTGIGFWAYADTGWGDNPGTAWDDFDGKNPDYAVVYEGPGSSIVSSRRWEAWRMGIEDYELLTMVGRAKGDVAAKALARSVLDNPQDPARADEVRRKMILELLK